MTITKEIERKLREYFDYQGVSYYTKEQIEEILKQLSITTTVRNLLIRKIIRSIYKNKIYQVINKSDSVLKLLDLIFQGKPNYYLGGIYIYQYYGFINQLPTAYQVLNTQISGKKSYGNFQFIFKKIKEEFFYGINSERLPSKERALLDYCYDFGFINTEKLLETKSFELDILLDLTIKYPIKSVARRIAYKISLSKQIPNDIMNKFSNLSTISLYEKKSRSGTIDKRWNIIINR